MSSKVLRGSGRSRDDGAKDLPESLKGKITVQDFGSRAEHSKSAVPATDRVLRKSQAREIQRIRSSLQQEGFYNVRPTVESYTAFKQLMTWTSSFMGDVPHEYIVSAVKSVIELTHNDELSDHDKLSELQSVLGSLSKDQAHEVTKLSKAVSVISKESTQDDGGDEAAMALAFDSDEDEEHVVEVVEDEEESSVSDNEDEMDVDPIVSDETLDPQTIDAYWLQQKLSQVTNDPASLQELVTSVFEVLEDAAQTQIQKENAIMKLFDYSHFVLAKTLIANADVIVWMTKYKRAESEGERQTILEEIKRLPELFIRLFGHKDDDHMAIDQDTTTANYVPQLVDLTILVFEEGSKSFMTGTALPDTATKEPPRKSYEQTNVPAVDKVVDSSPLVSIESLPEWAQPAFYGKTQSFNRIQSTVFPVAFGSDENMLICAPTGAGKTNIALLAMLQTIAMFRVGSSSSPTAINKKKLKMVYMAPLKALVQEQVREFGERLAPFGINVAELTGDQNLTKAQIAETQLIVTTPEKWDVITRKMSDSSYTNYVKLIVIDEIHLLHDERGPVLESIVSRTIRGSQLFGLTDVRLVGLSATLPNYGDVANFLRVEKSGMFYFDASYRPCPLAQKFIGITEKKPFKRYQAMNSACFDKVLEYAGKHQVIIFVHSRKETARTARYIRDRAIEEDKLGLFVSGSDTSRQILESESVQNPDLADLLPTGFAIHHAGLSRADRTSAEELFSGGHVQVLVCTATLAWGVNLPAHTVIINGTQVYNPAKGAFCELSPQDVLQMLGRAGRPKFDKSGEGIIITNNSEVNYYISLINAKLPIESQLMSRLADCVNAEIVLGNVKSRDDAVDWLGYTYLYVRMLQAPGLYQVSHDLQDDPVLLKTRCDLAHSALHALAEAGLVRYDFKTGVVLSTDLGRIASHFYISHDSMSLYNKTLRPSLSSIDLLRLFAKSAEFQYIPVRPEEKDELADLLERVPIPVKESVDDPTAKIIVLLQSYISCLKLEGFALSADMVYIHQSAGRLLRAIFEIALQKKYAVVTRMALDLCKMVQNRMWRANCPLRQFPDVPAEVIRKFEAAHIPWVRYFDLSSPAEVGASLRSEKYGAAVYQMLCEFPKFKLSASCQPITNSLLNVELDIVPDFTWNAKVHGRSLTFLILVEDGDGDRILYSDTLLVKQEFVNDEIHWTFTVTVQEPAPPNYFISVISERWLGSESKIPLSFRSLILPPKFPANTSIPPETRLVLVDNVEGGQDIFPFKTFNLVQSVTFDTLYKSDGNAFVGCSYGNGRSVCSTLALLRWLQTRENSSSRAVFVSPFQEIVDANADKWANLASTYECSIMKLSGDAFTDTRILRSADIILCTVSQWNLASAKWRRRKAVRQVSLVIFDDIHLLGAVDGHLYESAITRARILAHHLSETGSSVRLLGIGASIANGRDLGRWIDADPTAIFNFSPHIRMTDRPLDIALKPFSIPHHPSLVLAMTRFASDIASLQRDPTIIFASDRRECVNCATAFVALNASQSLEGSIESRWLASVADEDLRYLLEHGIGLLYNSMTANDKTIVQGLFERGQLKVLFLTRDISRFSKSFKANLVIVLGTQFYDGTEHRYLDYQVSDVLPMLGNSLSRVIVLTTTQKLAYYQKFLNESLPIESHVFDGLDDLFMNEIAEETIQGPEDAINWLTFTFMYRRLPVNPTYYGLSQVSGDSISEFLSELVEKSFTDLASYGVVEYDEANEDTELCISPKIPAQIASYYLVSASTINSMASSAASRGKTRALLEIICSATEFDYVPIRTHEETVLRALHNKLRYRLSDDVDFGSTVTKTFILLQSHISRLSLPPDLQSDLNYILGRVLPLVGALVDVYSGEGNLTATRAIQLSQSIVQSIWPDESPLRQIPHFDESIIERCSQHGIETVFDFINIEDDDLRNDILRIQDTRIVTAISNFVNKYPSIEMTYELEESAAVAGETSNILVTLTRDDDEFDLSVESQFYPQFKAENWWLIVGDANKKEIYGMKRQPIYQQELQVSVPYVVPEPGHHNLTLWCMCDSYVDADQELDFEVTVN